VLIPTRRKLSKVKLLRLLGDLEAAPGAAVTVYLRPGTPEVEIERALGIVPGLGDALPEMAEAASRSATGGVVLWGDAGRHLVMPPFQVGEKVLSSGYDVGPLRSMLERELVVGLVLLRLGAYAVGVYRGETLLTSKVGTGLVHARHRKGGSSQRRFERRRLNQMDALFDRVCGHVEEHLGPHAAELDHVVYGGERHTLLAFRRRCDFLRKLEDRVLPSLLNIREPKQASLKVALDEVWCSRLLGWQEATPAETT
jgi:hypothetical protein